MLTHYILVRRDLPLGVLAAMVTHAAGDSVSEWNRYSDDDHRMNGCYAVVLGVKYEEDLYDASALLGMHGIPHTDVYETGGPYDGQLMALGLWPIERAKVETILRPFQTLKKLYEPSSTQDIRAEIKNDDGVIGT